MFPITIRLNRLIKLTPVTGIQAQNLNSTMDQKSLFSTYRTNRKEDKELDLTFSDHETAFRSKTTWEVFRGFLVFRLCAMTFIVNNNARIMRMVKGLLGKTLFEKLMKGTFYGHFVAGEDEEEIQRKMKRLQEFGVNSILDYSAEEDVSVEKVKTGMKQKPIAEDKNYSIVSPETSVAERKLRMYRPELEFADRRDHANCRTYFYQNEEQCDKNTIIFLKSILIVGSEQLKDKDKTKVRFAAIKVTALGRPELLMPLSEAIARVRQYMVSFSGKTGLNSVLGHKLGPEDIQKQLKKAADANPEVNEWLDHLIADSSGLIHILPWDLIVNAKTQLQDSLKVPDIKTGEMKHLSRPLNDDEEIMFRNMMKRLHTIFTLAKKLNVRVMVDAEQSYFQLAISRITMEMMKIYNKDKAIVFNTYQCYLKDTQHELILDLIQSERQKFHFGAKLVRGAYMEQERLRASKMGYDDPINDNFEATTEMYKTCMLECLARIKAEKQKGDSRTITIMAATHNEKTVKFTIEKMKEFGVDRREGRIYFGQLYGMCDQISFPLGQAGYSVYKYVPYGPVAEVLPYLSRRLQENKGVLEKTVKERNLLRKELLRRLFNRK